MSNGLMVEGGASGGSSPGGRGGSSRLINGQVLRLHFACRAPLPPGSYLRVTSSTLWAPDSTADAAVRGGEAPSGSEPAEDYGHGGLGSTSGFGGAENPHSSSVEMVTSPEMYPLWRTKKPVVVVANAAGESGGEAGMDGSGLTQNHRYRYLVVTPGAAIESIFGEDEGPRNESIPRSYEEDFMVDVAAEGEGGAGRAGGGASTSNDTGEGSFPVMMWEDPFLSQREPEMSNTSASCMSLPSVRNDRGGSAQSLANLPWRTMSIDLSRLDDSIDTSAGPVIMDTTSDHDEAGASEFTSDGVRVDHWNDSADIAFRPYLEFEDQRNRARMEEAEAEFRESDTGIYGTTPPAGEEGVMEKLGDANTGVTVPRRIFLVCYHLPVILTRDPISGTWSACWSESLIAKTEQHSIAGMCETQWFGTVRTVPPVSTEEEREAIRAVLRPMNCFPIFLNEEVEDQHYLGMCKQVLWPAFHNVDLLDLSASGWGQREMDLHIQTDAQGHRTIPMGIDNGGVAVSNTDSDWDQSRLDGWWSSFRAVNQMFSDALASVIQPYDTVWVHDYHLCLLPKMLDTAEKMQNGGRRTIQMVYFLHIPFPTSQVFRELEHGEEILEGMLHADVVGFHAFDYARHFLNASKRILGLTYESLVGGLIGVRYRGKKVLVSMSNVSIEPDIVEAAQSLPSVKGATRALREQHSGRVIIAGVDVAQRLSGIYLKLQAYERLLTDYPVWYSKIVLVQKCLVPGSRRADEADTLQNIRAIVGRIQEHFGHSVIDYEEIICSSLPMDQRLALWSAADVLVTTPVREGLNLLPLEYIFSRRDPGTPGVVITSEFAAVSSILNGALRVNPYDIQMFVTSIDKALTMDSNEREARRARDIAFVASCPSGVWTQNVFRDLSDATNASLAEEGDSSLPLLQEGSVGIATMLSQENEPEFIPLCSKSFKAAYDATCRRVIIMDFNGTLVMKEPPGKYLKREMLGTTGNKPPPVVVKALTAMCADPRNVVFVVSGDTQRNLEDALGHVPGLGLAHSNGACFASPLRISETERTWHAFDLGVDWDAVKRAALPILSKYTARTNGSFVKLTHSSIGWSYYCCDPEWGSLQASYLVPELEAELQAFDVRFVTLKGVVEVVPRKLNKGLVVQKVLREVAAMHGEKGIDFVFCMGDDVSDEKMFTSVFSFIAESDAGISPPSGFDSNTMMEDVLQAKPNPSNPMYAYTVAVGKKTTHASYYVDSSHDVPSLLVGITGGELPGGHAMNWDVDEASRSQFA